MAEGRKQAEIAAAAVLRVLDADPGEAGVQSVAEIIEIALHVYSTITHTHYEMDHIVLLIGTVIGMAGAYIIDPKTASGTVGFVTGSVGQLVRGGRRATDTPVVTSKPEDTP